MNFDRIGGHFKIMSLNISFADRTSDRFMIVVTITVVDGKSVKLDSKVVSGPNEESLMIIALRVMPYVKNFVNINLGSIVEFLCKEYSFFRPSDLVTYFDQDCEEQVKAARDWVSMSKINRDVIRLNGVEFLVKDFVMEILLERLT